MPTNDCGPGRKSDAVAPRYKRGVAVTGQTAATAVGRGEKAAAHRKRWVGGQGGKVGESGFGIRVEVGH